MVFNFAVIIVLASCVASPSFAILSVVRSCSARPVVSVAAVAQLVSWVSSLPSLVFCSLPIILPYRLFPPFPSPNGVLATRGFLPVLSFFPPSRSREAHTVSVCPRTPQFVQVLH